ncbi:hypothetical protein IW140_005492 [Coemansia sp. RSA 1813]|nr:hypothetical protein EV178_006487 [Coemansia sp. RSA 1646]KAJ1768636.1 hypothetical protein LPJ74_004697 [Coemansia sp. RSA 1843]KAJ2086570.1 hypothetical protein IW138_005611 [Coemansia sp. RSA 986]KAJ2211206.1 hypothetical protein EV179_005663 [Coemansia sp. RSA 487]KAJ2565061.1 hypothetical protein IW140_005492 [Coemansia sp. RSA 1813]
MSDLPTVSDCSTVQYCTQANQALNYGNQYILNWNNKMPPLNSQSQVTVSVYSTYDLANPIYHKTNIDNSNGQTALQPDASWFSRYTGSDDSVGESQTIYFAVYLQGNDPPAVSSMLQLKLTATPEQYQEIQQILHSDASTANAEKSSSSASSGASAESTDTTTTMTTTTDNSQASSEASLTLDMELLSSATQADSNTSSVGESNGDGRSGLSDGAIAGIVVGSVIGLLLLLLLLLLPVYLRRRRSKRLLTKTGGGASGGPGGDADTESATSEHEGGAPAMAVPAAARHTSDEKRQHLDTPLLLGNRPNNSSSFTSHDDGSTYQPLSLESPRVLMHMPSSTRSAGVNPEAGLSTDDARQIGDSFRDALRKPPPISDEDEDDVLEEDPGWRERVANERMQRELEQEASVIRSVAMRAQGSGDLSITSPPPPSQP